MVNDEPTSDNFFATIKRVARGEPGITPRVFLSLVATCGLVAVAFAGSWAFAYLTFSYNVYRGRNYLHVSDGHVAISFTVFGVVWAALLLWIWRGHFARTSIVRPVVSTVAVAVVVIILCVVLDELMRNEEEYLMAATCFTGFAIAGLIWMRHVERWLKGRAVVGEDDQINVACPECGYSLIGLRDLRCPECGKSFTIDELIRAQGYNKAVLKNTDLLRPGEGHQKSLTTGNGMAPLADEARLPAAGPQLSTSDRNARMT